MKNELYTSRILGETLAEWNEHTNQNESINHTISYPQDSLALATVVVTSALATAAVTSTLATVAVSSALATVVVTSTLATVTVASAL